MAGSVCILNSTWAARNHTMYHLLMAESGFRTKESKIMPDIIVNSGGMSIAFMIGSFQRSDDEIWQKIFKVGRMFKHSYGLCICPTSQDSSEFARLYCQHNQGTVKPPIIEVVDERSALEKLLRMVHVLSEAKKQQTASLLNNERIEFVQSSEAIIAPLLVIPSLTPHEAQMLLFSFGSLNAVASASSSKIAERTGVSLQKAEAISTFFRDS